MPTDKNPVDKLTDDSEDMERLARITSRISNAQSHFSSWREGAAEDYDMFAGRQWDTDDEAHLAEDERMPVTFNRIPRVVNAVAGLEVQNRHQVNYLPREESDVEQSNLLNSAAKWVRDGCDASDEEAEMFIDTLICGEGWVDTRIDYEIEDDGKIFIERVDPLEMVWDPSSKKRNHDDAEWVARVVRRSKEYIIQNWPESKLINIDAPKASGADQIEDITYKPSHDYTQSTPDLFINDNKDVELVEYQYFVLEPYVQFIEVVQETDPQTGQPKSTTKISEDSPDNFQNILETEPDRAAKILKSFPRKRRVYKRLFYTGSIILEDSDNPIEGFTYRSCTGLRDRLKNTFFGIVRIMKDPQRWSNKWLVQIMHIMNTSAKNGYLYESGTLMDPNKVKKDMAKPGTNIEVAPGALQNGQIQPKMAVSAPQDLSSLLNLAIQTTGDIVGVNSEMLGLETKDIALGVAQERKNSGITILEPIFDSLHRYRKEQGRVLAMFIQEYISDGRLIRVTGPQGQDMKPLNRDDLPLSYDIVLDDTPTTSNMKNQSFGVLLQVLPMALQAGLPIPTEVLDILPLPEAFTQAWKKKIVESQQPTEESQRKQQIDQETQLLQLDRLRTENEKLKAEVEKIGSDATLNAAKTGESLSKADEAQSNALEKSNGNDIQLINDEQRKDMTMLKEQQRKDLESNRNDARKDSESISKINRDDNNSKLP